MNHQTKIPKSDSSNHTLPFCYGLRSVSCTVALCVVGGFSILEAKMSHFILSVLDLIQDQADDELKIQECETEVCLYV